MPVVRSPLANAEDVDSSPGSGRSPGGGHATHSSILAWRTPWTEEPGRLGLIGLQRVAHDWSNITCTQETVWRLVPCSPFSSCHCVIDTADTLPSFLRNFFTNFMPPSPSFCPPTTKHIYFWASLVSQTVKKNLPAMWEAQVWFLGWKDPLETGMATHSSTLAWRISWTEEPGRLQSLGSQRVGHDRETFTSLPFWHSEDCPWREALLCSWSAWGSCRS